MPTPGGPRLLIICVQQTDITDLTFPLNPPLSAEGEQHHLNRRSKSIPFHRAKPSWSSRPGPRSRSLRLHPAPGPQPPARFKPLEPLPYKSHQAPRARNMPAHGPPPWGCLGPVVSTAPVTGQYLEAIEKGFGPEEKVGRTDETEFADQGHRDGGGKPIARDGRDAPEPIPDVRHLRLLCGQDAAQPPDSPSRPPQNAASSTSVRCRSGNHPSRGAEGGDRGTWRHRIQTSERAFGGETSPSGDRGRRWPEVPPLKGRALFFAAGPKLCSPGAGPWGAEPDGTTARDW